MHALKDDGDEEVTWNDAEASQGDENATSQTQAELFGESVGKPLARSEIA